MVSINKKDPSHFLGSKYEETKNLQVKDLAKLLKNDLLSKVKSGELPKGKYSVRSEVYNGGQSISVEITLDPALKPKFLRDDLEDKVEVLAKGYNFYNGNAMTDEPGSRFYLHCYIWYK